MNDLLRILRPNTFISLVIRREVKELLENNTNDVNKSCEGGWTPLHLAVGRQNLELCEFLIEKGANVNSMTNDGETILDTAYSLYKTSPAEHLKCNSIKIINLLRDNGIKYSENKYNSIFTDIDRGL